MLDDFRELSKGTQLELSDGESPWLWLCQSLPKSDWRFYQLQKYHQLYEIAFLRIL